MKKRTINRDACTGRFVSAKYARENKRTTVTETITRKKKRLRTE